jgi:exodeoxyribonuclease VII small subunit
VTGYEQAREELAEVVRRLETGGTTLEEALALWERGEELVRICTDFLDAAQQRLDAAAEPTTAQVDADGDADGDAAGKASGDSADPDADGTGVD